MDSSLLTTVGLTPAQAEAYITVLEHGGIRPPDLAQSMQVTRTNAYKLLEKLEDLGLISHTEVAGKVVYQANNPMALASLTAKFRAEATAREEAANNLMQDLLARYHSHTDRPDVQVFTGRQAVIDAYRLQIGLKEELYFVHTRSDVLNLGFDTMHDIRTAPARYGMERHAIMTAPDGDEPKINFPAHKRSNLNDISWSSADSYTAPVEWSVTASSLLIVLYGSEPHAILITDSLVAGAFLQLWSLLSSLLKLQPLHQQLQSTAVY